METTRDTLSEAALRSGAIHTPPRQIPSRRGMIPRAGVIGAQNDTLDALAIVTGVIVVAALLLVLRA